MNELICSKSEFVSQKENDGTQYNSSVHLLIYFHFPVPTVQGIDVHIDTNKD